jgi:hypothetical protein
MIPLVFLVPLALNVPAGGVDLGVHRPNVSPDGSRINPATLRVLLDGVECACPRGGSYPLFHHSVTSCSRWVRLAWRLRGKGRRPSEARLAPRLGSPVGSQRRTGGAASALVRESPSGGSWWYDETGERNGTSGVSELRRSHAA